MRDRLLERVEHRDGCLLYVGGGRHGLTVWVRRKAEAKPASEREASEIRVPRQARMLRQRYSTRCGDGTATSALLAPGASRTAAAEASSGDQAETIGRRRRDSERYEEVTGALRRSRVAGSRRASDKVYQPVRPPRCASRLDTVELAWARKRDGPYKSTQRPLAVVRPRSTCDRPSPCCRPASCG